MTATEARQAALIEAAACIIEKACENRGADEMTIAEATIALENVYEVLALARQAAEAGATLTQGQAETLAEARAADINARNTAAVLILEEAGVITSLTEAEAILDEVYRALTESKA